MPTALSSTDTNRAARPEPRWLRPVRDVGHLMRFRAAAVRRRAAFWWAVLLLGGITVAAATVPAFVPADDDRRLEIAVLLPSAMAGILAISAISSVASGGGRELITREQGVAFPVSPTTDHLGALLLAPLNIAWLIQAWVLLGATAYALANPVQVAFAQVVMVLWLGIATALGQVIAWTVEAVRRRPRGVVTMRVVLGALAVTGLYVQLSGQLTDVLDRVPTLWLVVGAVTDDVGRWALTVAVQVGVLALTVLAGTIPAHWAARRLPHDELRVEADTRTPRPMPWSQLTALLRIDRASVWRAVPMRRGMAVLAIGPGLVALLGDLPWSTITVLPGLVVSGGALLFGVNAWCLDGRGLLWRENLPAEPGLVFAVRALVLAEFLGVASLVTIVLASLRAGVPTLAELTAVACTVTVVTVQVVGAALRWSDQRPYSVDLRSARATPAPPVVMVGYSARLALSTTLTGLLFSGLARVPDPTISLLVAVVFLAWSSWRLVRTRRRWVDPVARARVVTAVAA
ncbi:hypothetical protein [Nocardioides coralli]|uniref:hypothetical protein n=1 Tax=Nocardioides coralli TaxID=2872154 RepID=UPI001CA4677F|nr:hypothetical protein [Nocardioides coralli]QZY29033.1 hypothetical protein K6T13_16625 [Nocardioides coralli]